MLAQENQKRKAYSRNTFIERFFTLSNSFYQLQRAFIASNFFIHFDNNCRLFIDLNAFKKRELDVEICYVKKDLHNNNFRKYNIQYVLFLFKILSIVESYYWLTKLKISCLIWTIKKTRYLLEIFKYSTIIYINYSITLDNVKQTTLTFLVTNKLNLRLIRVL